MHVPHISIIKYGIVKMYITHLVCMYVVLCFLKKMILGPSELRLNTYVGTTQILKYWDSLRNPDFWHS